MDAAPAPAPAAPEPSQEPATAVPAPAPEERAPTPAKPRPAAVSHRSSARYNKTIDQPVVMPSSFGSGIEKVGMQFGSLSLGGESLFDSSP